MSVCRCKEVGRQNCLKHAQADQLKYRLRGTTTPSERSHGIESGPEFEVFGRYPRGWLRHILKLQLLGDVKRSEVLHVCSGTLSLTERWTVDLRPESRPTVIADGRALPFRDDTFKAILIDPPYSEEYSRSLYGVQYPRASHLLKEAARVCTPNGRIGMLHIFVPFAPAGCRIVDAYGVTTGVGYRWRGLTIWQKSQPELLEALRVTRESSARGAQGRMKFLAEHQHPSRPFKPGVRYFVCPNDRELDPPPPSNKPQPPTHRDRVLDDLVARGPGSMRELVARLGIGQHTLNGVLYQLRKQGAVVTTERRRATRGGWRGDRELVYAAAMHSEKSA